MEVTGRIVEHCEENNAVVFENGITVLTDDLSFADIYSCFSGTFVNCEYITSKLYMSNTFKYRTHIKDLVNAFYIDDDRNVYLREDDRWVGNIPKFIGRYAYVVEWNEEEVIDE